jgi:hypothetical protein
MLRCSAMLTVLVGSWPVAYRMSIGTSPERVNRSFSDAEQAGGCPGRTEAPGSRNLRIPLCRSPLREFHKSANSTFYLPEHCVDPSGAA